MSFLFPWRRSFSNVCVDWAVVLTNLSTAKVYWTNSFLSFFRFWFLVFGFWILDFAFDSLEFGFWILDFVLIPWNEMCGVFGAKRGRAMLGPVNFVITNMSILFNLLIEGILLTLRWLLFKWSPILLNVFWGMLFFWVSCGMLTKVLQDPKAKKGYRLVGDVCYQEAVQVASKITPVPGGVGPMTIAMLLSNTLDSAKRSFGLSDTWEKNSSQLHRLSTSMTRRQAYDQLHEFSSATGKYRSIQFVGTRGVNVVWASRVEQWSGCLRAFHFAKKDKGINYPPLKNGGGRVENWGYWNS